MTRIVSETRLKKWAQKKFCEQSSTVDLIASVEDIADKSAIAIVALLEVKPEFRYLGMCVEEASNVKLCHAYLIRLKREWGSQ